MSEPKRYAWEVNAENDFDLIEHSEGEYVRYADYARLKAEVERLTKAGDAMADELIQEYGREVCLKFGWFNGWIAAKGVQS
ncbi:hypothetical protein EBT31_21160 [bacterium]|nr:hypothetical protein [bacterium]